MVDDQLFFSDHVASDETEHKHSSNVRSKFLPCQTGYLAADDVPGDAGWRISQNLTAQVHRPACCLHHLLLLLSHQLGASCKSMRCTVEHFFRNKSLTWSALVLSCCWCDVKMTIWSKNINSFWIWRQQYVTGTWDTKGCKSNWYKKKSPGGKIWN